MKKETKIIITSSDIENMIKEKLNLNPGCNFNFKISENTIRAGSTDGVNNYIKKYSFDSVEVIIREEI